MANVNCSIYQNRRSVPQDDAQSTYPASYLLDPGSQVGIEHVFDSVQLVVNQTKTCGHSSEDLLPSLTTGKVYLDFVEGDAEVAFICRVDVVLHVLDLIDDAFDHRCFVLEQLWRELLVQPRL